MGSMPMAPGAVSETVSAITEGVIRAMLSPENLIQVCKDVISGIVTWGESHKFESSSNDSGDVPPSGDSARESYS